MLYGSSFYCISQVSVYTVCFHLMNSNMLICHIWHIISVMLKFNLIYKMQMNAFYGNLSINVEVIICKMNQFSIHMSFHLPYCCYSYLLPCQYSILHDADITRYKCVICFFFLVFFLELCYYYVTNFQSFVKCFHIQAPCFYNKYHCQD